MDSDNTKSTSEINAIYVRLTQIKTVKGKHAGR